MKIKTIVLFMLSGFLIACSSVNPETFPKANTPPAAIAIPTQTSAHAATPVFSATPIHVSMPTPSATPIVSPESDLVFEQVAQVGGSINGITVVGDLAYVGIGPRVAAIDISQHKNPQLVGQSKPLPGLVTHMIQISGEPGTRLLVNAGKYLVLVEISKPGQIYPIHQLELAGAITAMTWDDHSSILYAGGSTYQRPSKYTGFISAVGITPDNQLQTINTVAMPEIPISLAVGENSLFSGANGDEGGLYRIQLNMPGEVSTPRQVIASIPENPLVPTSLQVIGDRLYLGYWGVEAYDITNNEQPVKVWADNPTGLNITTDFTIDGDQIYVTGFSIREPDIQLYGMVPAPDPIRGSPMGKAASIAAMHKGDFIVADRSLIIFRAANPQNLQLVGSFVPPLTNARDAVANEKAIFVVDNGAGDGQSNAVLRVLSLPDLMLRGQVITEFPNSWWDGFHGIALDGNRVYLASKDSIWVYDVSRTDPARLGKIEIGGGELETIAAIESGEKRLLVISQVAPDYSSVLKAYDLTDILKPVELGKPLTLDQGNTLQIIRNESALYVLLDTSYHSDNNVFYVVDFDHHGLVLRESLKLTGNLRRMAIDRNIISLMGSDELLTLSFDELVKAEPSKQLPQTTLPRPGMGLAIINDMTLVVVGDQNTESDGAAQLLSINLQDPASIKQIEAIDIAFSDNYMVPILETNTYVILVNGAGGVEVLEFSP